MTPRLDVLADGAATRHNSTYGLARHAEVLHLQALPKWNHVIYNVSKNICMRHGNVLFSLANLPNIQSGSLKSNYRSAVPCKTRKV